MTVSFYSLFGPLDLSSATLQIVFQLSVHSSSFHSVKPLSKLCIGSALEVTHSTIHSHAQKKLSTAGSLSDVTNESNEFNVTTTTFRPLWIHLWVDRFVCWALHFTLQNVINVPNSYLLFFVWLPHGSDAVQYLNQRCSFQRALPFCLGHSDLNVVKEEVRTWCGWNGDGREDSIE
jgi:hypothetical protein